VFRCPVIAPPLGRGRRTEDRQGAFVDYPLLPGFFLVWVTNPEHKRSPNVSPASICVASIKRVCAEEWDVFCRPDKERPAFCSVPLPLPLPSSPFSLKRMEYEGSEALWVIGKDL